MPIVVSARNLTKVYGDHDACVVALDNVSLDIVSGQFTSIIGPSGCGKSTLLHCLAGLDTPSSGSVNVAGRTITQMNDRALTRMRRDHVGFIFQSFNLVSTLSARKNIELPLRLAGKKPDPKAVEDMAERLGILHRLEHKPHELSGGQQQRVAIARTLISQPEIIVADEPTGNLDSRSGAEVMMELRKAVFQMGATVIMVTHSRSAASYTDRVISMKDGRIIGDVQRPGMQRKQQ